MLIATTTTGHPVTLDPDRLLAERLLFQGASGSGKSYLLRRVVEQAINAGLTVTILDVEGEYSTLSPRYPVATICAAEDLPTTEATTALAESGARHQLSAVIDLSNLDLPSRSAICANYCASLLTLPPTHNVPRLVVLDEAHTIAPQSGSAETRRPLAELAARGRKRGIALICATQRLSKLHKDVAAELRNVAIGQTSIDSDIRKACETLAVPTSASNRLLIQTLRHEFLTVGPSFPTRPTITSLPPETSPPEHYQPPTIKSATTNPSTPPKPTVITHSWRGQWLGSRPFLTHSAETDPSACLAIMRYLADNLADLVLTKPETLRAALVATFTATQPNHRVYSNPDPTRNPRPDLVAYWPAPVWYRYQLPDQEHQPLDTILRAHPTYRQLETALSL